MLTCLEVNTALSCGNLVSKVALYEYAKFQTLNETYVVCTFVHCLVCDVYSLSLLTFHINYFVKEKWTKTFENSFKVCPRETSKLSINITQISHQPKVKPCSKYG